MNIGVPSFKTYWALNVSRKRPTKSLSSICLSACPPAGLSVRPSITKFSQDWIFFFFFDIVHDRPWYLVTNEARFLREKKLVAQILA